MNDEPVYQFVDTNVLIYAHDRSAGDKHEKAQTLITSLWQLRTGCLSVQVLQEFYVTVTRKIALPLAVTEAAKIISNLGAWRVHQPDVSDVLAAIQLQQRYQISFWDAMVLRSAGQLGCELLWSEDLNAGQLYHTVRVQNPF